MHNSLWQGGYPSQHLLSSLPHLPYHGAVRDFISCICENVGCSFSFLTSQHSAFKHVLLCLRHLPFPPCSRCASGAGPLHWLLLPGSFPRSSHGSPLPLRSLHQCHPLSAAFLATLCDVAPPGPLLFYSVVLYTLSLPGIAMSILYSSSVFSVRM